MEISLGQHAHGSQDLLVGNDVNQFLMQERLHLSQSVSLTLAGSYVGFTSEANMIDKVHFNTS